MTPPRLFWFRQDLRIADNPALHAAAAAGTVIPVFVLEEPHSDSRALGGASRWWLHHSLAALDQGLREAGSRLILRRGRADAEIERLAEETGAASVFWNRSYVAAAIARDRALAARLEARGIAVETGNASLLFEPHEITTRSGEPFRVFTPFWRACLARGFPPPGGRPARLGPPARWPDSDRLADWGLLPRAPDWAGGLRAAWTPGEAGARERLREFVGGALASYAAGRDLPAKAATSRLSPHLHFGEIGPRQIAHAVRFAMSGDGGAVLARSGEKFLSELGWREFSHSLLHFNPDMPGRNLRHDFDRFPWRDDAAGLEAWRGGRTGYPIVDAGMRELWQTGWMHNRVRMVVASFLVKHLLIDWRAGEDWFWDTLVDADAASNAAGWQWVAGSGADAAPYFRVFNPVLQGERFDADAAYVRRYVPEIARLSDRLIHRPWQAGPLELAAAGVTLGGSYPNPIIDHDRARERALRAFASLKEQAA